MQMLKESQEEDSMNLEEFKEYILKQRRQHHDQRTSPKDEQTQSRDDRQHQQNERVHVSNQSRTNIEV
jgi:hypothetical protein